MFLKNKSLRIWYNISYIYIYNNIHMEKDVLGVVTSHSHYNYCFTEFKEAATLLAQVTHK